MVFRSQIRAALETVSWIEVAGVAANGKIALEKIKNGSIDLVTLDLEMPEMSGIEVLKELKSKNFDGKILVFSSASHRGAEVILEALGLGATDFVAKPGAENSMKDSPQEPWERIKKLLIPKIEAMFFVPRIDTKDTSSTANTQSTRSPEENSSLWKTFLPEVLVIGSSTGGPSVLEKMFSELNTEALCPFLITQHMPPLFTTSLAERLSKISGLKICEAQDGMVIEKGRGYLAPGDYHMRVKKTSEGVKIRLGQEPHINSVRPAVDPLFESAAEIYKSRCLGLVLTGMGADGRDGSRRVKDLGGSIVIQSQGTCVVFGMPGAVKSAQAYDLELSPEEIVQMLKQKVFTSFRV